MLRGGLGGSFIRQCPKANAALTRSRRMQRVAYGLRAVSHGQSLGVAAYVRHKRKKLIPV
jgi:hypothetical protein